MIMIGNKTQIFGDSFIVQNNQEAKFQVRIDDNTILDVIVLFVPGNEGNLSWKTEGDIVRLTFTGWSNALGTTLVEPVKFGEVNNRKLYLNVAQSAIAENNIVHMFVLLGEKND